MTQRPRRLIVLGSDGLAREMASLVRLVDPEGARWSFEGFVGPDEGVRALAAHGALLGDDEWLLSALPDDTDLVLGIGQPGIRQRVYERFAATGAFAFPVLVHPTSTVDPTATLSAGVVVQANCFVSCDASVDAGTLINWNCTIGHDARIGSGCVVNPGANIGGYVAIGAGTLVGTGAQVLEGRRIGDGSRVGAGAVVTSDVHGGATVVGIPARPIAQLGPER